MEFTKTPDRMLIVRLSSLGDLVHALPVIPALRAGLPSLKLDWLVDQRWAPLLNMVEGIDEVISLDRSFISSLFCVRNLRGRPYACTLDLQGNLRSSMLTWLSGSPRRIGRHRSAARQPDAARFYTEHVIPAGQHIAEMSLSLAEQAGAKKMDRLYFPIRVPSQVVSSIQQKLSQLEIADYIVMCPGGGWRSKCWPAERYGILAAEIWMRYRIRTVFNVGPGERALGEIARQAAGPSKPVLLCPALPELAALLQNALVVIAGDTGPLHLAAALGTRVVGLFGPTSPLRNGPLPYGTVLQNALPEEHNHYRGNYARGRNYSPAMLSLTVEQVFEAVAREIGRDASVTGSPHHGQQIAK
jgi:heptosyltransferase-1